MRRRRAAAAATQTKRATGSALRGMRRPPEVVAAAQAHRCRVAFPTRSGRRRRSVGATRRSLERRCRRRSCSSRSRRGSPTASRSRRSWSRRQKSTSGEDPDPTSFSHAQRMGRIGWRRQTHVVDVTRSGGVERLRLERIRARHAEGRAQAACWASDRPGTRPPASRCRRSGSRRGNFRLPAGVHEQEASLAGGRAAVHRWCRRRAGPRTDACWPRRRRLKRRSGRPAGARSGAGCPSCRSASRA